MTTRRYLLISGAALLFVGVLMYTGTSFAQVNQFPSCSANTSTVFANQTATFTAFGGNGSYAWSADNFSSMSNANGSQFSVSFSSPGTNIVHVRSNGQTGDCSINVLPNTNSNFNGSNFFSNNSFGTLSCFPASQNVSVGQTANFSATGGNGSYTWIVPEISLANPNGTASFVTYVSPGTRIITVLSGGASATCAVNVIGSAVVPVVTIPSLPNTGGGYGKW